MYICIYVYIYIYIYTYCYLQLLHLCFFSDKKFIYVTNRLGLGVDCVRVSLSNLH